MYYRLTPRHEMCSFHRKRDPSLHYRRVSFPKICSDGKGAGLVLPLCNTEAMDLHLREIGKAFPLANTRFSFSIRLAGTCWKSSRFPPISCWFPSPKRHMNLIERELGRFKESQVGFDKEASQT